MPTLDWVNKAQAANSAADVPGVACGIFDGEHAKLVEQIRVIVIRVLPARPFLDLLFRARAAQVPDSIQGPSILDFIGA